MTDSPDDDVETSEADAAEEAPELPEALPEVTGRAADAIEADPTAIHRFISLIIEALPAIGKGRQVTGGGPNYRYRGIEDILPHIHTAFSRYAVHCTPKYRVLADQTFTVRSGAEWRRVVLEGTFRFWCAHDGSWVETVTIGEATDMGDKSFNKAMTAAYKYALVQTFCLTEAEPEDPDGTSSTESESFPGAREATPPEGAIAVTEAKGMFLSACGGDADCASEGWESSGLDGHRIDRQWVPRDLVEAALAAREGAGQSGEAPDEGESPAEAPEDES